MCVFIFLFYLFFFQAEDGIRDLVRSRGLGDVYKRQVLQVFRFGQDECSLNVEFNGRIRPGWDQLLK